MANSITSIIFGIVLFVTSTTVVAVPIFFFGEDLATGRTVPPAGNAAKARANFLNSLTSGVGVEDFESFESTDVAPYNLSFPGSTGNISATLTNAGGICDGINNCVAPASGEFATSGDKWLFTEESLAVTFSDPIAAFGFYGTDIGDLSAQLTITLTDFGGAQIIVDVAHTLGPFNDDGDLLFWGFVDPITTYTKLEFGLLAGNDDFFGFDDLTIGELDQVNIVPEPTTLILLAVGLAGLILQSNKDE